MTLQHTHFNVHNSKNIVTGQLNAGIEELAEEYVARQTCFRGYELSTVGPLSNVTTFLWQPQQTH
jgi:hypothetical protein